MASGMICKRYEGAACVELAGELVRWCDRVFDGGFAPGYLTGRLHRVADPMVLVASGAHALPLGFKLGYRRGAELFYSWLGGVFPEARGAGVARALSEAQHVWATQSGYRVLETRTRCDNNPMILLNLKLGFSIVGLDVDREGRRVVTLRKELSV